MRCGNIIYRTQITVKRALPVLSGYTKIILNALPWQSITALQPPLKVKGKG
nr:MAG TPA: hypothetical protein [Caudoviricetes sp.]